MAAPFSSLNIWSEFQDDGGRKSGRRNPGSQSIYCYMEQLLPQLYKMEPLSCFKILNTTVGY